ncbi:MAG: hypothetical protein V4696_03450 [Pseudomonadota bacterium]
MSEPDRNGELNETPGSLPPEQVEDRPNVGTVEPDDYPEARENDAGGSDRGRDGGVSSTDLQEQGMGEDESPPE